MRTLSLAAACLLAVGLVAGAVYYFLRQVPSKHASPAGVGSLAVLPFKPLVPEGREEALEVGMADTLIAKLSNISGRGASRRPSPTSSRCRTPSRGGWPAHSSPG